MRRHALYLSLASALLTASTTAAAADWPQWQGPDRNSISKERGLLQEWPDAGPPLAWRVEGIGGGYGAPSIASGKIFGMSSRGADEVVWALSEADGKELWVTRLGPALTQGMPQGREGPGCTPTVDGDRLYVLGLGGALACLEAGDGKVVWQKSLTADFGGRVPTWRYNESPLIDGDKLICTPGGDDATLVALDKSTGDLIWKSKASAGEESADSASDGSRAGRGSERRGGERPGRGEDRGREERPAAYSEPAAQPLVLISAGSQWKYLDNGTDPGPAWTTLAFEDDAWREGPAQLGYGDGDEKTRLDDAPGSYPTYYFRTTFEVADPSKVKPLVIRLIRDDGAVVFINGHEVLRDNMPAGKVGRDTYAEEASAVEDDYYVHELATTRLVAGRNVLAVEVHQSSADSSDVSFDLELREKASGDVVGAPRGAAGRGRGGFGGGRGGFGGGRGGFGGGGSGAAYSSAIAMELEGRRQYVQLTATTLLGVAASDGKVLWRYDRPANRMGINCSTPLVHDGLVFAASAYGNGGGAVKLSKDASGAFKAEEVYFTSAMQNHHGGMVVIDGCLYGANGGNGGGFLSCLDFTSGEVLWRDRQAPKGSVVLADGRIYLRAEEGTMLLVEPNREQYVERGRFEQPDRTRSHAWTHPVIANGKLYIRDQDTLFCYDVKAK